MNRVAIVVLNWNGITDTIPCLDSLLVQSYKNSTIVVVDNGSKDDSLNILEKYTLENKDKVHLIPNSVNKGFTGGVNTGIKWAIENDFEYVALFNNDAVADKNWLQNLVDAIQPNKIGISTGLLLHEDGKTIDSSGDWVSKWGLAFPRNRGDAVAKAPESGLVFGATGGATLYKTALFKNIGLFDELFFAYYEDADISFRAQLAGYKVFYSEDAIAYHKQGATSNKMPGFAVYQTFKNLPLLFLKNTPTKLLWHMGIRFYFAYFLIYFNSFTHQSGKSATKGLLEGIVLSFRVLGDRYVIQKQKRVSAEYIKSILWDDLPPDQTGLRKVRKLFTGK